MVAELSGRGHKLYDLLEVAGLARSSYYYALAHPQQPTRAQLRPKVAQIFSRTPNGCGHRQVAMCLRAEEGVRIADKTVLKMMRQMGLRCGIRRERAYHRYNSYKGDVGQSFTNIIGRNFTATGPWQKLGTDVTEFKLSFGKAYLAPVYDFASKRLSPIPSRCAPTSSSNKRCFRCSWMLNLQGLNRSCIRIWGGSISTRPTSECLLIMVLSRVCHVKVTASTMVLLSRFSVTLRTSFFVGRTGQPSRVSKLTLKPILRIGIQQDAR